MKTLLTVAVTLLCSAIFCSAQRPTIEYGSADDLKGVVKVFVDTGMEMEVRENIIKEISKSKKKLPELVIVSKPEDADVVLVFGSSVASYLAGINTTTHTGTSATSTPVYNSVVSGKGYIVKLLGENRVRVLMSFDDDRSTRFERRPSTNFARQFVRAYLKANLSKP